MTTFTGGPSSLKTASLTHETWEPGEGEPPARSYFAETLDDWLASAPLQGEGVSRDLRHYLFIEEGAAVARFRDGQVALPAGAVLMVPPGIGWSIKVEPGSRGLWLAGVESFMISTIMPALFHMPAEGWEALYSPTVYASMTPPEAAERRRTTMAELLAARERLFISEAAVATYMLLVLTTAIMEGAGGQAVGDTVIAPVRDPEARLVLAFRGMMEQHLADKHSVTEYARMLGVSVDRLNRACRVTHNMTPLSIMAVRMVQKAKVDLLYSREPVATIGYRLGFADPAYFSRFFKRHTGKSPSEYREAYARPENDQAVPPLLELRVTKIGALNQRRLPDADTPASSPAPGYLAGG